MRFKNKTTGAIVTTNGEPQTSYFMKNTNFEMIEEVKKTSSKSKKEKGEE